MKQLIDNFSKQLFEAIKIGEAVKLTPSANKIRNVFIAGLGGSGIGGSIVAELVYNHCKIPVTVGKGYFLPEFVNESTLFIASSYSGNTEETLTCLEQAIKRNAKIVCITSGGKVAELAIKNKLDILVVPGGMPPRACLGYSLTQLLFVFSFHNLTEKTFKKDLQNAIALIDAEKNQLIKQATEIASKLKGKIPVIYCTTNNEGIAIRFRQQLNENAKILCWHHVIPEMNHNELVGWTEQHNNIHVIILRNADDFERNNVRIEINKEVIKKYTDITEVYSKGNSAIEKAIYTIHLCDWISVILADERGVDAVEVNVINQLKSHLAKS